MSERTLFRSDEVINNLRNGKGFTIGEAYAYAFGYAWAMLDEKSQLLIIEKTEQSLKEKK
jgi:hypothetical protein